MHKIFSNLKGFFNFRFNNEGYSYDDGHINGLGDGYGYGDQYCKGNGFGEGYVDESDKINPNALVIEEANA